MRFSYLLSCQHGLTGLLIIIGSRFRTKNVKTIIKSVLCNILNFRAISKHSVRTIIECTFNCINSFPFKQFPRVYILQLKVGSNFFETPCINGQEMPFLYNCSVDVPAGYRMSRELTSIAYKNLNTTRISHICIWVVDEHGTLVNFRDDDLTVTLSLRLIPRATTDRVEK